MAISVNPRSGDFVSFLHSPNALKYLLEPDMQDIGWGWNILEDWKLDEGWGGGVGQLFLLLGEEQVP